MKRRSAPTAAHLASQPIEFLPRQFFLVVLRHTPRFDAPSSTPHCDPLPKVRGKQLVELEATLLEPLENERRLDARHTIRFCRFMNAMRRKHTASEKPLAQAKPSQVLFYTRSAVRGDEGVVLQLLVRWRVLCLRLPTRVALDPFRHNQSLFDDTDIVGMDEALGGIKRGIDAELLVPRRVVDQDDDGFSIQSATLTFITKRFVICQCPTSSETQSTSCDPADNVSSCNPIASQHPPPLSVAELASALKAVNVTMVVKLNALPRYDDQPIIRQGIGHLDLSAANNDNHQHIDSHVIARFLESCENSSGVIAVHSSTGMGRAALCIACFLVKHHDLSASEAIGWLRFCLPDAVPKWHAGILHQVQASLRRDGEVYRCHRSLQEERSNSFQSRFGSRATLDDLALSSLRLTSQISIGQISLGRESLLGTKDKNKDSGRDTNVSPSPVRQAPGSLKDLLAAQQLIATDTTLTKRRPLTQGTTGRRRVLDHHLHRASDAGNRADFVSIHKFLHQSSTAPVRSSGFVYTGSHGTPLRSAATAPDVGSSLRQSTSLPFD